MAGHVLLATSVGWVDALAASQLAARLDAPVLLTDPHNLESQVRDALSALDTRTVSIVGGPSAVSAAVEQQVRELGLSVRRLAGADRWETAAVLARQVGPADTREAVVALGHHPDGAHRAWPDALAASNLTAQRLPLLLTAPTWIPDATLEALADLRVDTVWVVGGPGAVGTEVQDEFERAGYTVRRVAGADRYQTAIAAAGWGLSRMDRSGYDVVVATGENWPDGLVAGALAAHRRGPLVLTHTQQLAASLRDWLVTNRDTLTAARLVGGTAAISEDTRDQIDRTLNR